MATALFGAGCFWGVEKTFSDLDGVSATEVGYAGGDTQNPSYEDVCTDTTGHAEVVKITYDPATISFEALLKVFFENHNPTTLNQQGPDVGSQYRSVVFYYDNTQKDAAEKAVKDEQASGKWRNPVVTQVVAYSNYFPAEDYHQKYLDKRGLSVCHI